MAINDTPISPDMEQDDVVKVIVGAGRPFAMKLLREVAEEQEQTEEQKQQTSDPQSLSVRFEAGPLGLSFVLDNDCRCIVQNVKGQSQKLGLRANDEIVGVNGAAFSTSVSQEETSRSY